MILKASRKTPIDQSQLIFDIKNDKSPGVLVHIMSAAICMEIQVKLQEVQVTVLNAVNHILTVTCKSDKAVFLRDFC